MTGDNPLALDPETMRRLGYSTVDLLVDRLLAPARPVPVAGGRAQMIRNLGGPPPEDAQSFESLLDRPPVLSRQGTVRVERRRHRPRAAEGGIHGIPDGFEDGSPMALDDLLEQRMVAGQRDTHRGAVPLEQLRAAFDVAEQERDRPGRQQCHAVSSVNRIGLSGAIFS